MSGFKRATKRSVAHRFWKRVHKTDGCWLWTGRLDKDGYGRLRVNGRHVKAHRYSFVLHGGELATGMLACHSCDNPSCVNPEHLFAGTHKDNTQDAVRKHRMASGDRNASRLYPERRPRGESHHWQTRPESRPKGERNGRAKLSAADVLEIRRIWAEGGHTKRGLGRKFGVSDTVIYKVVMGKSWAHFGGQQP